MRHNLCPLLAVPSLRMQILGGFQLTCGVAPITGIETPRQQALLSYLVLQHGIPQSRTKPAVLFWPDSTEGQAHANLRNLLYKVRQGLPYAECWLLMDRLTLMWRAEGCWNLDVLDFERAVAGVRQAVQGGDRIALRRALEQAAALYRGELLLGCYDAWVLRERDRCSQMFLGALERLLQLREEEGDEPGAIRLAQRLLREDPLQEASYRHLMRLYARSGNRAAIVRTYQSCAAVLQRELAIEPDLATRHLYEQLVQAEKPTSFISQEQAGNSSGVLCCLHSVQRNESASRCCLRIMGQTS